MDKTLFSHFSSCIRTLSAAELQGSSSLFDKLTIAEDGTLRVCYAPFEYINTRAKVVLVGITPGRTQMINAIKEARRQMDLGADDEAVLRAAKATGAFSGTMRPNLTGLLDAIGIHQWLGISGCDDLFDGASHLVQTTSLLRNPVFVGASDYNGTPKMTRHPMLRAQLSEGFANDMAALPGAIFVPLGSAVADALHYLASDGQIPKDRILDGLPHPSGANAERIAYFLGRKSSTALSKKTNASKIDAAKEALKARVLSLA